MATQTQHYQLSKPEWSDRVDVRVLNSNTDVIDAQMYDNEQSAANAVANMAAAYDDTQTYNVDDFCIYGEVLYKCTTAVTVAEAFDSTKWTQTTAAENFGSGGGGNANERVLTTAEYNALSEAEKMNNTTYYINDAIPEGKEIQPVIYSLQEREVGVWTDGKPLYQKTIKMENITLTITSDYNIDISNLNIDVIASSPNGYIKFSNSMRSIPLGLLGNYSISIDADRSNLMLRRKGGDIDISVIEITIQYTKTTDTAGSGNWVPNGAPAIHYSTDEHVIGTWIDGSTLYEKTITAAISNRSQWIDTGVDNTNTIVYSEGFLEHSGGIVTLASADPEGQVGINTFVQSVVTTGKWSVLYRAKQEHTSLHAGDLTVTIRYTKSS
jgi:hypothetical protein